MFGFRKPKSEIEVYQDDERIEQFKTEMGNSHADDERASVLFRLDDVLKRELRYDKNFFAFLKALVNLSAYLYLDGHEDH